MVSGLAEESRGPGRLTTPTERGANKLRDVLNAAWRCRLNEKFSGDLDMLESIQEVAVDLCILILDEHEQAERSKLGGERSLQGSLPGQQSAAVLRGARPSA